MGKRAAQRGEVRLGKNYYDALRRKYEDPDSPLNQLTVRNAEDPIDAKLKTALTALKAHGCNRKPFQAWSESNANPNQHNVVAALKACLSIRAETSPQHCGVVLECVRRIVRNKLEVRCAQEACCCKSHFDGALTKSWLSMKKEGVSSHTWWSLHGDVAGLVVAHASFERCVQCVTKWDDVAQDLSSVATATEVGRAMFGLALKSLQHGRISVMVADMVAKLASADISGPAMQDRQREFVAQVAAFGRDAHETFACTEVTMQYRGVDIKVHVGSIIEQYQLQAACLIKGCAVDKELLPALSVEDALVLAGRKQHGVEIDGEVLKEAGIARKAASDLIAGLEEVSGESIAALFQTKHNLLVSMDRTWKI